MKNAKHNCPHCGSPRPNYYIQNGIWIRISWPKDTEFQSEEERKEATRVFTPYDALSILRNLSDQDCIRMGLAYLGNNSSSRTQEIIPIRPEYSILEVLVVPTVAIRPSIAFGDSNRTRGQDDLTNKLQDILKASLENREVIMEFAKEIEANGFNDDIKKDPLKSYFNLQFHVATYFDNNIPGQKQSLRRCKIPTKCVLERFIGKGGRFRGNLQGKRVEFSARTVISPDMNLDLDQLGIPWAIAEELTIPEVVNALNIHDLQRRVHIGAVFPHGARYIIKDTLVSASNSSSLEKKDTFIGAYNKFLLNDVSCNTSSEANQEKITIDLKFCQKKDLIRLQYGWVVERYMRDDDLVILNRQPSLRKLSLMAHRVKLMKDSLTFRLNLGVCAPYNADFDGDEMNVHFPQIQEARAELQEIMTVPDQLLNAQNNRPSMGLTFDPLLGSYLLTHKDRFFDREEAMEMLNTKKHDPVFELPIPAILKPKALWTGKQLFTALIPDKTFLVIDKRKRKFLNRKKSPKNLGIIQKMWDFSMINIYVFAMETCYAANCVKKVLVHHPVVLFTLWPKIFRHGKRVILSIMSNK